MHRNLDRRVEVLVRVPSTRHREALDKLLDLGFAEDSEAWHLEPDGSWVRKPPCRRAGNRCAGAPHRRRPPANPGRLSPANGAPPMASRSRSPSRKDTGSDRRTIKAAGGVVWRDGEDGREVLLVHRPKYDDWSLPKGKLTEREPRPAAAVREIVEETGWRVRLGSELPDRASTRSTACRRPSGTGWPTRSTARPFVPNDEVDQIAWVDLAEAKRRLRPSDHALVRGAVPKASPAAPLVVVRHALSIRRKEWQADDRDRPLSRDGKAQAARIAGLLEAWAPLRVVTSSVASLPGHRGAVRRGSGPQARADRRAVRGGVRGATRSRPGSSSPSCATAATRSVVCTHRPLLATVARVIGLDLPKNARSNPLPKGGLWVAHAGRDVTGRALHRLTHAPSARRVARTGDLQGWTKRCSLFTPGSPAADPSGHRPVRPFTGRHDDPAGPPIGPEDAGRPLRGTARELTNAAPRRR